MCQNLLPFANEEIARYGLSGSAIRLKLLCRGQAHTFAHSNGIIFLTQHVRDMLLTKYSRLEHVRQSVIPHGIDPMFLRKNEEYQEHADPIRLLYVSRVDLYKHQWNVVSSVSNLRKEGFNIQLTLVGSAYPPALDLLNATIEKVDLNRTFIKYEGSIDYVDLPSYHQNADLFIFASSCETFGISLLEAMASKLPIACSSRPPIPEVLGDAGVYFDPENITSITNSLRRLLMSSKLRRTMAEKAKERANEFTWEQSANDTFQFLSACI
jgi:glycosyltransferase involved in cell wall biosynthesis